jgi:antitoxin VapB
MGAQLNIKSEDAYRMASRIAELTGESLTAAVTIALQERLEREEQARHEKRLAQQALAEELLQIGRDCAADLKPPFSSTDHADFYGEDGLPA